MGKLSADAKTFVIDDTIGEAEFEADENEVVLKVKDLTGEFGIFLADAAAGGDTAGGTGEGEAAEEGDKAGQIDATGLFGSLNRVEANVFTNLDFAANVSSHSFFSLKPPYS